MYADKPMRGHGLMQAIARVHRVFRDKQRGLIVDDLGLADQLKQALATYTESGGQGSPIIDTAQAVAVLLEKYEVCCDLMHGFDWSKWMTGTITVVLDNAWHEPCVGWLDFAASRKIELLFLPSYLPNINLIERCWAWGLGSEYQELSECLLLN